MIARKLVPHHKLQQTHFMTMGLLRPVLLWNCRNESNITRPGQSGSTYGLWPILSHSAWANYWIAHAIATTYLSPALAAQLLLQSTELPDRTVKIRFAFLLLLAVAVS